MIIEFTLSEADCMALTEEYLRNSPSHQRSRSMVRWLYPIMFVLFVAISSIRNGLAPSSTLVVAVGIFAWIVFYPRRFDARVRKHALTQMKEASYAKNFGDHRVEITDDSLLSTGPTGKSEHYWAAVDRIVLTEDYLLVFFTGFSGLPISVQQIGTETASSAYDLLSKKRSTAA